MLSITEVSRRTGLSVHTLRYYERIGLITSIPRAQGGQRYYRALDLAWIEFLLRLRSTQMPIREMQQFAQLRSQGDATAGQRQQMLERHLLNVQRQIAQLQQSSAVLDDKIKYYAQLQQALIDP